MSAMPIHKYRPFAPINLPDRRWPARVIDQARRSGAASICATATRRWSSRWDPTASAACSICWSSSASRRSRSASRPPRETDFDFVRELVEQDLIPEDVTIQVLTQARAELIERSFEAIRGARRAIMHLYNSTSTLQRRVVFGLDKGGIADIAVNGARLIRDLAEAMPEHRVSSINIRPKASPGPSSISRSRSARR